MSHAGFGNVHGDIVDLATSGGAAPAFPPVEDDLRLPAQPKDVSDLRKGDVVAFDEALQGRLAREWRRIRRDARPFAASEQPWWTPMLLPILRPFM